MGWRKQENTTKNIVLNIEDAAAHNAYSTENTYRFTILRTLGDVSSYITADEDNKLDDSTKLIVQSDPDNTWLTDITLTNDEIDTDTPSYFLTFNITENTNELERSCDILINTLQNELHNNQLSLTIKQPGIITLKNIYLAAVTSNTNTTPKALKDYLLGIQIGNDDITPLYDSDDTSILIYNTNSTNSTNKISVLIQPINSDDPSGYFLLKNNEDNNVIYNNTSSGGSANILFNNTTNVISYTNWNNNNDKTFTLTNYPDINIKLVNSLIIYNFTLYATINIDSNEDNCNIYYQINENSTIAFGNNSSPNLTFKDLELSSTPKELGKEICNASTREAGKFLFTINANESADWTNIDITSIDYNMPICTIDLGNSLSFNNDTSYINYTISNSGNLLLKESKSIEGLDIYFYVVYESNRFTLYCSTVNPTDWTTISELYIELLTPKKIFLSTSDFNYYFIKKNNENN